MNIDDLRAELTAWQRRPDLFDETNFSARAAALDFLDFVCTVISQSVMPQSVIPQSVMPQSHGSSATLTDLCTDAQRLADQLTALNRRLFGDLRRAIQRKRFTHDALYAYCDRVSTPRIAGDNGRQSSYDGLDILLDGLFTLAEAPAPTVPLIAEMVHCEETPARVILDLVDQITFGPTDRFYDLGCGLGQVVMLVNLLSGVPAYGIEIEPAFVTFAQQQANALALENVHFLNRDVQVADFADGTVFFLFTPFRGQIMQRVLARLQALAAMHPIRICTFGPCTPIIAQERWLHARDPLTLQSYTLAIFESL